MVNVSVIIPAYNSEKYIGKAIESVIKQTYQDFIILIGNDGSIDNTVDINDIIILINFILEINQFNINFQNIDFIDDNVINIYDLLYLLNLIIN